MVSRQTDRESSEVRVYRYGIVPLGPFPEEAVEELYRANNLWNRLVELHNQNYEQLQDARCAANSAYAELMDQLAGLNEKIDVAYDAKRTARMLATTRAPDHPDLIKANKGIAGLKSDRSALYKKIKPARSAADKNVDKEQLKTQFREAVNDACKAQNTGLYNVISYEIRAYFETARNRAFASGGRLQFHQFDGSGFFAFRFRRPKPVKVDGKLFQELFIGNRDTDERFIFTDRDDARKKPRLRLRVTLAGSNKAKKIRHEFDVIYHRPIPEDGMIKNGKIIRQRTGDRFTYHLVLTVKRQLQPAVELSDDHAIGVDLGFRRIRNSIRVAVITPGKTDEPAKEVFAPEKMMLALEHMETIKSEIDEAATDLGKTIKPLFLASPLDEEHKKFKLWRQAAKFKSNGTMSFETAYKLARWMLHQPDDLPAEAVKHILKWWRSNGRKYREIHNLRAKQLRNRKHFYRQVAAEIVALRRLIVLEDIDLSVFAEARDKDTNLSNKARAQRFLASPSEFRNAIISAAEREKVQWIAVPPQYTSKTCSDCDEVNNELKSEETWTCPACGVVHDRDINAALNIARRGQEFFKKTRRNSRKT
jgi:transposase